METLEQRLGLIDRHLARAVAAAAADQAASPITRAVLAEFERKAHKAAQSLQAGGATVAREVVVELEQAADSAKIAALADQGASTATREAVTVAHDAICLLKHEQAAGR